MKPESTLLPADWTVPAVFRQRLGENAGRQRLMEAEGHLLLVLHAPPEKDEAGRRGRFFWRDPQGTWKCAPRAEQVASLADHVASFRAAVEQLEQAEEEAQTAREYFDLLDHLAPLVRSTRNLYEVLQQAREAMPGERRLIVARDEAYEISRRTDLLYDDTKNGLDYRIARQSELQAESSRQMAVSAHRLNVLVALFFPLATLTAVFGMNLGHGLEWLDRAFQPWVLLGVTLVGLILGVFIKGIVTRPAQAPKATEASTRGRRGNLE